MSTPMSQDQLKILERQARQIIAGVLKDPNVIGWTIKCTPTSNEPSIMINKIPYMDDPTNTKFTMEIVFLLICQ